MKDPIRQAVLIDMAYEIGGAGLAGFKHLLAAYRAGRWATAAAELKASDLYNQVPKREQENMMVLALGEFPEGVTCASDLIRRHEGCILTAKPDNKVKGSKWVIGWGRDIDAPAVGSPAPTCTQEEAEQWLIEDFALAAGRAEADIGVEHWITEAAR